jgi:hypothetical protein
VATHQYVGIVAHTLKRRNNMSKDLQELVTQYTNEDGAVNWEEANKQYQSHINGIVTKNVAKETEKVKESTLSNFIKEIGIEGNSFNDVKLWAKKMGGNTDEIKEANLQLSKELEDYKTKYTEVEQNYNKIQSEFKTTQQLRKINELGFVGDEAEFLQYKLSKQVTEDVNFDDLLKKYAEENSKVTTTQRFQKKKFGEGDSEFVAAFKARRK